MSADIATRSINGTLAAIGAVLVTVGNAIGKVGAALVAAGRALQQD